MVCGIAATVEKNDANSTEVKIQVDKVMPVQVHMQDSKPLAVEVRSGEGQEFPVKIEFRSSNPLPVELALKDNDALTVKAGEQGDEGFLVQVKESWITISISVTAVVIATIASFFAWRSAHNAKLAAQGSLFFELMHRYDSDDMVNALRNVWSWDRKTVGEDKSKRNEKAKEFVNNKAQEDSCALEFNQARRKVTHYYLNVLGLGQLKYLKESVIKRIFIEIGAEILDVLEPLEIENIKNHQAKNETQKKKAINELKRDFKKIRRIVNE